MLKKYQASQMPSSKEPHLSREQARRQDLAAGDAKNQKEGPKTKRGPHF